jgi:hypothetical protein
MIGLLGPNPHCFAVRYVCVCCIVHTEWQSGGCSSYILFISSHSLKLSSSGHFIYWNVVIHHVFDHGQIALVFFVADSPNMVSTNPRPPLPPLSSLGFAVHAVPHGRFARTKRRYVASLHGQQQNVWSENVEILHCLSVLEYEPAAVPCCRMEQSRHVAWDDPVEG